MENENMSCLGHFLKCQCKIERSIKKTTLGGLPYDSTELAGKVRLQPGQLNQLTLTLLRNGLETWKKT